ASPRLDLHPAPPPPAELARTPPCFAPLRRPRGHGATTTAVAAREATPPETDPAATSTGQARAARRATEAAAESALRAPSPAEPALRSRPPSVPRLSDGPASPGLTAGRCDTAPAATSN